MSSVNQKLSLYIPHVFPNISDERIRGVFLEQNLGDVGRIDRVSKIDKNGKNYFGVYLHFNSWCEGATALHFQERVLTPEGEARIVYDDPWHWIVLENTGSKRDPAERKVCVNLTDSGAERSVINDPAPSLDDYVRRLEWQIQGLMCQVNAYHARLGEAERTIAYLTPQEEAHDVQM